MCKIVRILISKFFPTVKFKFAIFTVSRDLNILLDNSLLLKNNPERKIIKNDNANKKIFLYFKPKNIIKTKLNKNIFTKLDLSAVINIEIIKKNTYIIIFILYLARYSLIKKYEIDKAPK